MLSLLNAKSCLRFLDVIFLEFFYYSYQFHTFFILYNCFIFSQRFYWSKCFSLLFKTSFLMPSPQEKSIRSIPLKKWKHAFESNFNRVEKIYCFIELHSTGELIWKRRTQINDNIPHGARIATCRGGTQWSASSLSDCPRKVKAFKYI